MALFHEKARELQALMQQVAPRPPRGCVTSGSEALDRLLPDGGFRRGTLVEWMGVEGCGATTLAMIAAREACRPGRALAVVDRSRRFYPPAAARLGIELENLVVVHPTSQQDYEWALNQLLHGSAVTAVVCWPEKLDARAFRRLQLAAETGGSLGLLVRSAHVASKPSWANTRLLVRSQPNVGNPRVSVELLRCHGGQGRRSVELEINHETHTLHLATELASATTAYRPTGT